MGWVHRYKHRGAVLALIALALQIALTFGHVHLRGLAGGSQRAIAEQIRLAHAPPQAPTQNPRRQRRLLRDLRVDFFGIERFRAAAATACPCEFPAGRALAQCRQLSRTTAAACFPIARSAHG